MFCRVARLGGAWGKFPCDEVLGEPFKVLVFAKNGNQAVERVVEIFATGGKPNSRVTKGHLAIWPKLIRIGLAKMPNLHRFFTGPCPLIEN
jgi:hypothetical protein